MQMEIWWRPPQSFPPSAQNRHCNLHVRCTRRQGHNGSAGARARGRANVGAEDLAIHLLLFYCTARNPLTSTHPPYPHSKSLATIELVALFGIAVSTFPPLILSELVIGRAHFSTPVTC